ncbi:hypothetical protein [Nocardioides caricicola]|uniref:Uncharacterized protein n=1 Tax=Nocardioides caricicola TaxID=634770 RepID=A0ABW0N6N2_9ACTN
MTRSRSDLLWGGALLLVAAALAVQLLVDDPGGGFQRAAWVLRLVLVLGLAALFLTAHDLAAMAVAAGSVVLLVLTWTVGLLVAPEQFVGTGAKAPENVEEAQALGLLLTALLLVVAVAILRRWWRSRRDR